MFTWNWTCVFKKLFWKTCWCEFMVSLTKMGPVILVALLPYHTHTLTSWYHISWINMQFSVNQYVFFESTFSLSLNQVCEFWGFHGGVIKDCGFLWMWPCITGWVVLDFKVNKFLWDVRNCDQWCSITSKKTGTLNTSFITKQIFPSCTP